MIGNENLPFLLLPFFLLSPGEMGGGHIDYLSNRILIT